MKLLSFLSVLLLISALVLESDAWWRRRRRRSRRTVVPTGCSTPPTLAYTSRSGCSSPYIHGESCTYRCHYGYTQVSGSTTRTCSNGAWTGTNLVCRRGSTCPTPTTPSYTSRSGCSSPYTNGERCTYRCLSGYSQVSGSTTRICSNGAWTGTNLVCRRGSTCPTPPTPSYTYRSGCYSPYTNGERCYYRCYSGYTQVSGSTTRICSNGAWTGTNLVCSGVRTCPTPPTPAYTYRSSCYSPYTNGERCYYRCHRGLTQVSGSTVRICSNGRWTGSNLVCSRGSICSTPPTLAYTSRSGCSSPYTNGERCYYRCHPGYSQVSGSTTRICSNKAWTGTNLVCRRGSEARCPIPSGYGGCWQRCYSDEQCGPGRRCCFNGCGRVCMNPINN